jgi:hypothetical protein
MIGKAYTTQKGMVSEDDLSVEDVKNGAGFSVH